MGVLYNSSTPSQFHMNHDGFCIVDDWSCISFTTKYRSAHYSRTASSLYHSSLLVICRVGHVRDANYQRSLPEVEDQVKTIEESEKAKHNSDGPSALFATATERGRSVSCGDGTRNSDNFLTGPIQQSRLGARKQPLGSLAPGDAANIDSKPRLKPASLGNNQTASEAKPLEESVKDRHIAETRQEEQKPSFCSFEDNINAADVPLPPSPSPMLLLDRPKGKEHGLASIAGRFEKRQRDDSDDDITQIPVRFKKAMKHTQKVTVSVQQHDANVILSAVLAKPSDRPSTFDVSLWLDVDWQSLTFTSFNYPRGPHSGIQVSLAVSNADSAKVPSAALPLISTIDPVSNEPNTSSDSFVSAIQKFDELVGSCDASARFAKNSGQCLANNGYGTRCGSWHGIRIEDRPMVGNLLAELKRLNFESSLSSCVYKLLTFTNLAVCPYQRKGIREKVAGLLQQRQFERPHDKGLHKYLAQFLPYRPPELAHLTVNEFVVQQAMEPFDANPDPEKELGKGYLYVYWNEATFGVRKIGFTTKQVSDRLKQWETDCKHAAAVQYSSPCKVRHAARVEQLLHADLLDYRVYEPACRTCLKSHIEWFRGVNLPFIIGRIEAWSQWISEGPYQKVGRQWRLTNKGRDSMPIVTDPNSCRDPEILAKLPANLSRRYNLRHIKGRKPSL